MDRRDKVVRLAVFVGVILIVVGLTAAASYAVHPTGGGDRTGIPAYNSSAMIVDPIAASGEVSVDLAASNGIVVVDRSHRNRFDRSQIDELENALTAIGYEVRFHDQDDELGSSLAEADAFVVIDPAEEFEPADVDTVESFVDQGGRLLLLGEPTRGQLQVVDLFAVDIVSVPSEIDTLANRFGFTFGTDYLYNLNENDGNYRNILVTPASGAGARLTHLSDVERGALYTATFVDGAEAEPVLVGTNGTVRSNADGDGREFVVAAVDGDVMAVGDSSFLSGETFNVADNELVIAALVEFLATGDREPTDGPIGGGADGSQEGGETGPAGSSEDTPEAPETG